MLRNRKSPGIFAGSVQELKNLHVIVLCGVLGAMSVALGFVGTVRIGPYIRIGLSGIPERMVDLLFGPAVGGIFGAVMDILKYIVNPGGVFFPGFTLSAALTGIVYGIFLYEKKLTWVRVLIPEVIVRLVVNLGLNTIWLTILYGESFFVLFPARLVSNLIQIPIETVLIYMILQASIHILGRSGWKTY